MSVTDHYETRRRLNVPGNWRTRSDNQIIKWAFEISEKSGSADSDAQELIDEMWEELAERDYERGTFG